MMTEQIYYWLMDGRANFDIDRALVLETCDTLAEAKAHLNDYGADTCLVEVDGNTQTLVDSLMWTDDRRRAGA